MIVDFWSSCYRNGPNVATHLGHFKFFVHYDPNQGSLLSQMSFIIFLGWNSAFHQYWFRNCSVFPRARSDNWCEITNTSLHNTKLPLWVWEPGHALHTFHVNIWTHSHSPWLTEQATGWNSRKEALPREAHISLYLYVRPWSHLIRYTTYKMNGEIINGDGRSTVHVFMVDGLDGDTLTLREVLTTHCTIWGVGGGGMARTVQCNFIHKDFQY